MDESWLEDGHDTGRQLAARTGVGFRGAWQGTDSHMHAPGVGRCARFIIQAMYSTASPPPPGGLAFELVFILVLVVHTTTCNSRLQTIPDS